MHPRGAARAVSSRHDTRETSYCLSAEEVLEQIELAHTPNSGEHLADECANLQDDGPITGR